MLFRFARTAVLLCLVSSSLLIFLMHTPLSSALAEQPTPTPDFKQLCQAVLARALTLTESGCVQTGRNQACYGYTKVHSQLQSGVDPATNRFSVSGDILPVSKLATIHTDGLDTTNG